MKYLKKNGLNKNFVSDSSVIPNKCIASEDLSTNLEINHLHIQELLDGCSDAVIRKFKFGKDQVLEALLVYFDGLISKNDVEKCIMQPLILKLGLTDNTIKTSITDIYTNVKERT